VLEPTVLAGKITKKSKSSPVIIPIPVTQKAVSIDYMPEFVFNNDHLWIMIVKEESKQLTQEKVKEIFKTQLKKRWNELSLGFSGQVHKSIIEEVIKDFPQFKQLLSGFGRILLFGPIVDKVDNFFSHDYNPIEHFDNGYVIEGCKEVESNIKKFKANRGDIFPLCIALHAVADFYAHTTYAHFAIPDAIDHIPICNFSLLANPNQAIDYLTNPSFVNKWGNSLSENTALLVGQKQKDLIQNNWNTNLLSGRYAQLGDDDNQGFIESLVPIPEVIFNRENELEFSKRAALPHHDEIAVDTDNKNASNSLYNSTDYSIQYTLRLKAAKEHIRSILSTL
jgi:hypothetical protein